MNNREEIYCFRGLRGIAFIFVFVSHCTFSLNSQGASITAYFGAFGVSIFIVLSGFLTVSNHYNDNELSTKRQIKNILRKCYPLHFMTFLFAIPFSIKTLITPNINSWVSLVVNLLLMQSWIPKTEVYFSYNAVSWYLSTYLFLMIVSPFVVKYLKKSNTGFIICLLLCILSIQFTLVILSGDHSWAHWLIYICPITRALDFISGGGIAVLIKRCRLRKYYYCLLFYVGIVASIVALMISTQIAVCNMFLVAIWSLPSYTIIAGLYGMQREQIVKVIFQNQIVLYLGKISLELFLVHQLVIRYIVAFAKRLNFMSTYIYIFVFLTALVVATILYELKLKRTPKS